MFLHRGKTLLLIALIILAHGFQDIGIGEVKLTSPQPVINSVCPNPVSKNHILIITGKHFGPTKGYMVLNGRFITSRRYIWSWEDNQIIFRVPSSAVSGCLKIFTKYGGYSDCVNLEVR